MISHFTIRKFSYLKTVRFAATVHSTEGGSSSGGEEKSIKSTAGRLWFGYREAILANPNLPVIIEDWYDFDANDEPLMTTTETTIGEFIVKMGKVALNA